MNSQIDIIPQFNFWSLLLLICAGQAFFFSVIFIFHKKGNKIANKFLAVLIFLFSLYFLFIALYWSKHLLYYPNLMGIIGLVNYSWGPLFYLYVSELLEKNKSFNYKRLLHFIPAVISIIYTSRIYFFDMAKRINHIKNMLADESYNVTLYALFLSSFVIIHIFVYTVMSVRKLNMYSKRNNSIPNTIGYVNYNWLKKLSYSFIGFFFTWFMYEIIMYLGVNYYREADYTITFFGVLVFFTVAVNSLRKPEIISGTSSIKEEAKYEKSKIPYDEAQVYLDKLEKLMKEEKIFLDSELNIKTLSEKIDTTPHRLSQVINEIKKMNFPDYISTYRIEEAKKRLSDPQYAAQTILSIAYDVGFNNKVTFNNTFKKHTGLTPSEFKTSETISIAVKN